MSIVDKILEAEKETPIMIHSKIIDIGENIYIFGRFGNDVKIKSSGLILELTGNSLYGVINFLTEEEIKPNTFIKGNCNIRLPGSSSVDIELFKYAIGTEKIKQYLKTIDYWDSKKDFRNKLQNQMNIAKTFGISNK